MTCSPRSHLIRRALHTRQPFLERVRLAVMAAGESLVADVDGLAGGSDGERLRSGGEDMRGGIRF